MTATEVRRTASSLTLLCAPLLSACAVGGAAFEDPVPAPVDGATFYIYRPAEFQGSALTLHVTDNGREIGTVKNGQFIAIQVKPGHHELSTNATRHDVVAIDAAAGETDYMRFGIEHGVIKNTMVFIRVYSTDAIPELRECCKSGPDLEEPMR